MTVDLVPDAPTVGIPVGKLPEVRVLGCPEKQVGLAVK